MLVNEELMDIECVYNVVKGLNWDTFKAVTAYIDSITGPITEAEDCEEITFNKEAGYSVFYSPTKGSCLYTNSLSIQDFEMDELLNQTGEGKPVKESDITIRAVNTIFFSLPEDMKPKVAYTVDEEGVMYPVYAMLIKRVVYSYKNQSCIGIFIQTIREYKPWMDLRDFDDEDGYSVDTTTLYLTAGKDTWRTEPAVTSLRSEEYKKYYDHIKAQEQTQDELSDYASSVGYWIIKIADLVANR
jgi:hypothetical protein